MDDEMEAIVKLLDSILQLSESDQSGPNANASDHISEILLNYRSAEHGGNCELSSYVNSELSSRFELSNTDDSFQLEASEQWGDLFDNHWDSVYYAVSLQILISLANVSLLNKMKLSKIKNLKLKISNRLKLEETNRDTEPLVASRLNELLYQVLSVDCKPADLLRLYSQFNQCNNYDILNSLAAQTSDPLAQNYLQIENGYKILKLACKSLRCTLHFFLEFNNITSNRIATIGENIYLEVKEGQFCISNDEFIIGLFEEFEIEPAILYSLALTINDNDVSLYVDGNYISTVTLLEGSITAINQIELGSLICSFKLFRFTIYDEVLTPESLKIVFALGPHFKNSFERDLSIHGLQLALDDAFLEKLSKSISPSGVSVEKLSKQTQQLLHRQHILIDFDPSNEYSIQISEDSESLIGPATIDSEDPVKYFGFGKYYYYKGANLVSIFTSINCFRFIFCSLENCKDMDELYNFLSHLMILLRNDFLRLWFKKQFGFPLLSHILIMKVIKKLDRSLPIQFLNLFQEYCGWDFSNISDSLIGDEEAYQSLVLNFDLWYHDSSKNEENLAGTEIIRFLFFQITSLLGCSNYKQFNSQKLINLNVLEKLCYFQHFFSEKHGYPNMFKELKSDLIDVYVVLLKDNLKKSNVQWLLQFSHFESKSGYFENAGVAMNAVDQLFTECLSTNDTKATQTFMESVSPKFLLMVLDEIVPNRRNPRLCLNILFKLLLFNPVALRNFTKGNGVELLFDILKDTDLSFYENVICLLYAYSLGSYNTISSLTSFEDFQDNDFVLEMKVVMRDPFYLAIELLEWAVINDIRMPNPADLDTLIAKFLSRLYLLLKNPRNYAVFDPRGCPLFVKLSSLFITLTKPQNSSIYVNSSKLITDIITTSLLHAILTLTTSEFEKYLEAMTPSTGSEQNNSPAEFELGSNLFEMAFLNNFFVVIFQKLNDLNFPLESHLVKNPSMASNILLYFNKFKRHISIVKFRAEFYLEILETAVNLVEVLLNNGLKRFENVSKFAAVNLLTYTVIPLLFPVFSGESSLDPVCLTKFCKLLEDHSETLFDIDHGYRDKELTKFILSFLLSQLADDNNLMTVCNCLKTVLSHNLKELPAIASSLTVENGPDFNSILMDIAHNESILRIVRENNLFGDSQRDRVIDYALKRINTGNDINIISQEELKEKILHCRLFQMDNNYTQREKRHRLFSEDNVALDNRVRTIYRKFYTNFVTDMEQDTVVHNNELLFMTFEHAHTLALQLETGDVFTWELDLVEDFNRMRRRMIPSPREFHDEEFFNANDGDSKRGEAKHKSKQIRANSVLSYDIISELETLELFNNDMKDENRKVLKVLRGKDSIKTVWNCSLVIGLDIREGILVVSQFNVYFISNYYFVKNENKVIKLSEVPEDKRDPNINLITGSNSRNNQQNHSHEVHLWLLSNLTFVTKRPFLLRDVALELLFENGTNCFVSFDNKQYRDAAYSSFEKLPRNKNIDPVFLNILRELNSRSSSIGTKNGISRASLKSRVFKALSSGPRLIDGFEATSQWQKGEISNFYYLVILNTLAGRTFNDLTQYPVFPWVISDYTSEELDLSDESVYRDLSKPMGAQSKKRELQFVERYEALKALNDENIQPFHYGTHYSSAMIVSSYLIRLKPFVDSFLLLQDGNFGHADRLFNSVSRAWASSAIENTTDVRELTPEFFFLPELFLNMNNYNFGKSQKGNEVNDVVLPPWAKGDSKAFVWKNREALESPYVSEHLHEWIDLIFGSKQRGEEAVSSVNVFNNLSYPGAVNLDSIDDEMERRAVTGIIHNFGQTPLQIFQEPHPPKQCDGIHRINEIIWSNMPEKPNSIHPAATDMDTNASIRYIYWQTNPDGSVYWNGYPFLDVALKISGTFVPIKLVLPCSLRIGLKIYDFIHQSRITSFTFWKEGEFITGDQNGLIKVWCYSTTHNGGELSLWGTLHGHLAGLKDMKLYPDYNTLVSVDELGTVYMWDLIKYRLIRKLSSEGMQIAISQNYGNIAIYTKSNELSIYSFNGLLYTTLKIDLNKCVTRLEFLDFSGIHLGLKRHAYWQEKDVLVVGYSDGSLEVYELVLGEYSQWSLKLLKRLKTGENFEITCIKTQLRIHSFDNGNKLPHDVPKLEIMAGDNNGNLFIWR